VWEIALDSDTSADHRGLLESFEHSAPLLIGSAVAKLVPLSKVNSILREGEFDIPIIKDVTNLSPYAFPVQLVARVCHVLTQFVIY
jgi:hypothetical protein